jgi:uncharacterized membrane-anchored protein
MEGTSEFRLKAAPVDPFDPFYGYYATLNYEISRLPLSLFQGDPTKLKEGQALYVLLAEKEGVMAAKTIAVQAPAQAPEEVVLKARLGYYSEGYDQLELSYGFERFYTTEAEASALEEQMRKAFEEQNQHPTKAAQPFFPVAVVIKQSAWGDLAPWAKYTVDRIIFNEKGK